MTQRPRATSPRGFAPARRGAAAIHLLDCWPPAARALRSASHLALCLDFDGTLVALRPRPEDVQPLDEALRKILRRLARHQRMNVYVVSGRPLAQLRRLVPLRGVRLLGLHGWEGRDVPALTEERRLLRSAKRLLEARLAKTPKVRLEDKGLGLAVHYRGAPPGVVPRARAMVREIVKALGPKIHVVQGHKVWELLPSQISGKGSAVSALLARLHPRTLAIFVGDDTSDEAAFKVLPRGLTVRVGRNPRTHARYFLRDPAEVKIFLLKLAAELRS